MGIPEITVNELKRELASDRPPTVIDVREADELEICRLSECIHIPMMEVPHRLGDLNKEASYAILCHSGGRSGRVTAYMLRAGFKNVRNVAGGIDSWAREIDPAMARY